MQGHNIGRGDSYRERSVIGGNVWLTESVPPDTKVFLKRSELILSVGNSMKKGG